MSVKMSHIEIASAAPTGLPKGRLYIRIRPVPAPAFTTWREFPPEPLNRFLVITQDSAALIKPKLNTSV